MANQTPIFVLTPNIGWGGPITTGNAALNGTGIATQVFTAGNYGSRVDEIRAWNLGSNVPTVLRLFVNNGGAQSNPLNNSLIYETGIANNTLSQTAESIPVVIKPGSDYTVPVSLPLDSLILPSGYQIWATVGTTIAAGMQVTVLGGSY